MQKIELNSNRKVRKSIYLILLFITAFACSYYLQGLAWYISTVVIILSMIFAIVEDKQPMLMATFLDENEYYKLLLDSDETGFWRLQKKIVINSWVYVYFKQDATNKKVKVWLYKSNFIDKNGIREFARCINI